MTSTKNTIGFTVQIVGAFIIIIAFFRAIASIDVVGGAVAFEVFMQGIIYGVLFLGFGEVINLMQGIFNQREPESSLVQQEQSHTGLNNASLRPNQSTVSSDMKWQIQELYAKKKMEVDNVEETPFEGFVCVYSQGKRDIVDLNGFHPQILTAREINEHPVLKELPKENPPQ